MVTEQGTTQETTSKYKRYGDVYKPEDPFHPDLEKVDFPALLDGEWLLKDVRIMRDWDGPFGRSDWVLLMVEDLKTGDRFTSKCGGTVVVKQVEKMQKDRRLPMICTFRSHPERGYYYIA